MASITFPGAVSDDTIKPAALIKRPKRKNRKPRSVSLNKKGTEFSHAELVSRADKWLQNQGCKITLTERMGNSVTGESPDAIGWKDFYSVLIEVKTSRSDFLADKKKRFRKDPSKGMGDFRFYLCPKGLIQPEEVPEGWGLLWATEKTIQKKKNIPKSFGRENMPFEGNKRAENQLLTSALRKVQLMGHYNDVYEKDLLQTRAG